MYTKDEAYKQIADLTERFGEQLASYKKSDYNETLTRRDFIDPFCGAVTLVDRQKQTTTLPEKLEQLNQRIQYTDDKINKLVYEIYGLTEEEVGIVEGRG